METTLSAETTGRLLAISISIRCIVRALEAKQPGIAADLSESIRTELLKID